MAGFITIEQVGPSIEASIDRLIKQLTAANRTAAKQAATIGRKAMLADLKARRGSTRFRGKALSVKTKTKASADGATVTFQGSPAGAWAIISTGTKAHEIRRVRAKALHWGGDAYAVSVHHPGTSGRGYWQSAGAALDEALGITMRDVYAKGLAA